MEPDLRDLLTAWVGGEVEPARCEELLVRVRRDEAFRRAFVAEVWMLGTLKAVQAPESRWLRLEDELGWSAAEPSAGEGPEERIVRRLHDSPRLRRPGWWRRALATAAAALLVAGLAAWLWPRGRHEVPVAVRPNPAVRSYPKVDTMVGLAMVIKLDEVQWETTGDPHPSEGDVLAAGRLLIRSGRATLSMLTGVVLWVEGPADVELVSDTKLLCHRGSLRVRVPNGAEGFVVSGPGSAVLDLGTEFGLIVEPDGTTRAKVFKGGVEAAVLSAAGIPQRTYLLKKGSEVYEIDSRAGRLKPVAGSEDFIKPSDLTAPPLTPAADYPATILRSRPWGYWRFESMADGAIPNEIRGRPPLRVIGPVRLAGATEGNRCAEFAAVEDRQYLEMEGPWQPTWRPGYAVELWCLSVGISTATLASMPAPDTGNHCFLLELTARTGPLHKPASVRLLHRWPPGWSGGDNVYSQDPYVPYRWHHVVGQINGARMELFVDGEPAPGLSVAPDHADLPCQFLLGRLTTKPGSGVSIDRPFVGRLDEVALYDRPLAVEEIREHHRLGTRPSRPR
jgi:hypothetical protein